MPGPRINTEGIILSKENSGESQQRHFILTPAEGGIFCFQHKRKSKTGPSTPDLFDLAELSLEQPSTGQVYFIKEYRAIHRFTQIGAHYDSFKYACEFSLIISKNVLHAETFQEIYSLCIQALQAWEKHLYPEVVFLKSLYIFARDEGYPVKEDWRKRLDSSSNQFAHTILHKPIEKSLEIENKIIIELIDSFKQWLTGYTDIIV